MAEGLNEKKKENTYHHGDLKKALLASGIKILNEKGVNSLSLRACATDVGVSHAAPQYHFGNLRNLLTAIATKAHKRFYNFSTQALEECDKDPITRANFFTRLCLEFFSQNPGMFNLTSNTSQLDMENKELAYAISKNNRVHKDIIKDVMPYLRTDLNLTEESVSLMICSCIHGYVSLKQNTYQTESIKNDQAALPDILSPILKI